MVLDRIIRSATRLVRRSSHGRPAGLRRKRQSHGGGFLTIKRPLISAFVLICSVQISVNVSEFQELILQNRKLFTRS